jgi:adenylate kinase family enzyme
MIKIESLESINLEHMNIFIVGKPASGKTYLSNLLKNKFRTHIIIHTDDYIFYQIELVTKIRSILSKRKNYILEGNQGYSILNHLNIEEFPNLIIELEISDQKVYEVYKNERSLNKFEYAMAFHNSLKSKFEVYIKRNRIEIPTYSLNQDFVKIKKEA